MVQTEAAEKLPGEAFGQPPEAPYVARVPAGVAAHTFIDAGSKPFRLIVVLASKHPKTTRIGPDPLLPS